MPDEQGRQIRDRLNLKPGYVVARKGTSKESDKITKATGGRVSHVGLVTDVDAKDGKVTIIHSYPHEVGESAIQEITAEEFFSKNHHVAGTSEYCRLNWFYRILAYLVGLDISPVFISPQQIIDSDKLTLTPEEREKREMGGKK